MSLCKNCHGEKTTKCQVCDGKKKTCSNCSGTGKVKCSVCGGSGEKN